MVEKKRRDIFAQIADREKRHTDPQPKSDRGEHLIEPRPPTLPQRFLPIEPFDPDAAFTPLDKLDTPQKLARELEACRQKYAPFTRDLAPEARQMRITVPIKESDWRVGTEADLVDFGAVLAGDGEWERVSIPHFGPPLGRATTYYRTTFEVTEAMRSQGAIYVRFKGVDYKAHVFVNSAYLGSHEGFFAPFECQCTGVVRVGENVLLVQVENDAICMGNNSWGDDGHLYEGDKIYAATGLGYDDPEVGWHHSPPGMGIHQDVCVEARPTVHIHDVFVRPLVQRAAAEAWIEVYSAERTRQQVSIELSLFGQNFRQTLFRDRGYELSGLVGPTVNYFRLPFEVPDPRLWDMETPWLYQLQVKLCDAEGRTLDVVACSFGMRSFQMEEVAEPKGRFYLNGRQIQLRGANTMGHMQQCVIQKDWDQLRDDILLAKICHMNYLRLTQRPVQSEIYDFCDRLGIMTQTDLPLFGVLRRNQFSETVRQAGEMERLVRAHPCSVMVTYINEPFPNAQGKLHRHLSRPELESFFAAADEAVHLENPDRVIKAADGDYDPPGPGLPDNHCYCGWYNGHGVDLGRLHKGYWQKVKPGWHYGCGEFGSEGLDPEKVMRTSYPEKWLPQGPAEEGEWTPDQIVKAQTGRFHYMWFDTQHTLAGWIAASQAHQAWITRLMTEAFRRDARMVSIAFFHFVDAFPAGWMKSIMDVERQPKPAYFAYREALTPLMVSLRTDRYAFQSGEEMALEAWVCNDLTFAPQRTSLHYRLDMEGEVIAAQRVEAQVPTCSSAFQGFLRFQAPEVKARSELRVRLALVSSEGQVLHDTAITVDLFPPDGAMTGRAYVVGGPDGVAARLAQELGLEPQFSDNLGSRDVILIDDWDQFAHRSDEVIRMVEMGATAVFLNLPSGGYEIAGDAVEVVPCGMNPRHFCSRATGHPTVAGFRPTDFCFWYDDSAGYVTPFLATTFTAPGWTPILTSGNGDWSSGWEPALAAAEKVHGQGRVRVCQVELAGRTVGNPVALIFARRLLALA